MTALITGMLAYALLKSSEFLTRPVTFEGPDPAGTIRFTLASGMHVTVTTHVEPVA